MATMTAAAAVAVLWPLAFGGKAMRSGADLAVFRDQLDELDRDFAAGSIGKRESEAARVEISRRLLAASVQTASVGPSPAAVARHRRVLVVVAFLLLPVSTAGLYLRLGSPGFATETLLAQGDAGSDGQMSVQNLVAKVEAHLQSNPKDGRGWEILAPVYMQLARYPDAVNAWRNCLQLLGESADREANLGEALFAEANGIMTAEARAAFNRAVALDGNTVSGRYYLGVAAEQDGRRDEAAKIWRDLIAGAPSDAHWVADVRAALARVESTADAPQSAPSRAQTAETEKQATGQQSAMIRGMVDRLAARLKENGSDPEGWARLVRSYKVLGDLDKAQAAISDAQRALANDPDRRQRFDTALKEVEDGTIPAVPPDAVPPPHGADTVPRMVERLAERLKKSGSDPDGWVMLARSYVTLGDRQKTATAIKDARAALAVDAAKLQYFNEALRRFKIDETGDSEAPPSSASSTESSSAGQRGDDGRKK